MENKKIGTGKAEATHHTSHNAVEVMKPFVTFGVKALGLLATALVHIVKNVPKPDDNKAQGNNKVIKI
jgi:hypothetical protein